MFCTSVRDGRGGDEMCEWNTACTTSRSFRSAQVSGSVFWVRLQGLSRKTAVRWNRGLALGLTHRFKRFSTRVATLQSPILRKSGVSGQALQPHPLGAAPSPLFCPGAPDG